jgi:hypothetical protein
MPAPLEQSILEYEGVELVDQDVVVASEPSVEIIAEHQLVVPGDSLEKAIRERFAREPGVGVEEARYVEPLRLHDHDRVRSKYRNATLERRFFVPRKRHSIHGNDYTRRNRWIGGHDLNESLRKRFDQRAAKTLRAAATVASISDSVCAADTNPASNADGAR